ncbi:BZ3500_MvSof-1268-A1-R1_Chr1-3g02388 [Microbotryum saponariae]|uniref:BZ3500_MvSof-1268-A1-R1_Chr1-3g02388 protein n=1 Tax=Microbotryum saponariae TaxID=289078 RepID=A0A2X0MH76_9BASI|nr:BZ3500_MvSof-1268-A1-R1_Chr1-3g02388 [Microbotryum saponariae]SCZ96175.1 BZ3501_MvSof-1269-A2-R1_Chr1-3g01991 [Microbotryum saponariae]
MAIVRSGWDSQLNALHARNKVTLLAFDIRPMAPSVPKAFPVTPPPVRKAPKPKIQRLMTPDSTPPAGSTTGERRSSRLREVVRRNERRESEEGQKEGTGGSDDWSSEEEGDGYEEGRTGRKRKRSEQGIVQRDGAGNRPNTKIFGHQRGVPVGTHWAFRMECSQAGVHAPVVAGIAGNEHVGAWSVALSGQFMGSSGVDSGGYKDDVDVGYGFTFTGSGGRDLKGTSAAPKNLRTAPQTSDQVFTKLNAALKRSVETRKPVRVIRGFKGHSPWAPVEGYRYDGLYIITKYWQDVGEAGFKVCKYAFQRMDGQPEIPVRPGREEEAAAIIAEFGKGSNVTPPETAAEFRARSSVVKVEASAVLEVQEEKEQPVLKIVREPLTPETSPINAGRMVRSLRYRAMAVAVEA